MAPPPDRTKTPASQHPATRAPSARTRSSSSATALRLRRAAGQVARRRRGPPSPALIFVPPLALCAGVVGVAALHGALGMPLGAAWAAEVWGLAKTAITAMIAIAGAGGYIHRNNRRAWEAAESWRLENGRRGDGGSVGGGEPPDDDGDGEDGPPRGRSRPALPATTESVRARRTGKLSTVAAEHMDVDDADHAGDTRPTSRQAGGRWGGGGTR